MWRRGRHRDVDTADNRNNTCCEDIGEYHKWLAYNAPWGSAGCIPSEAALRSSICTSTQRLCSEVCSPNLIQPALGIRVCVGRHSLSIGSVSRAFLGWSPPSCFGSSRTYGVQRRGAEGSECGSSALPGLCFTVQQIFGGSVLLGDDLEDVSGRYERRRGWLPAWRPSAGDSLVVDGSASLGDCISEWYENRMEPMLDLRIVAPPLISEF